MSEVTKKVLDEAVNFLNSEVDYWIIKRAPDDDLIDYLLIRNHWYYGADYICVFDGRRFVYKLSPEFIKDYETLKEKHHETKVS